MTPNLIPDGNEATMSIPRGRDSAGVTRYQAAETATAAPPAVRMSGGCLGIVWGSCGDRSGVVWESFEVRSEVAPWSFCGCLGDFWELFGGRAGVVRGCSGSAGVWRRSPQLPGGPGVLVALPPQERNG